MSFFSRLQDRITNTFRAGVERVQNFFQRQPPPTQPEVKKEVERVEVDLEAKIKAAVERATADYQSQLDSLEKRNTEALERLQRRIDQKNVTIQQLQTPTDQPLDVFAVTKKQDPKFKETPYYYRFELTVIDDQGLEIDIKRTIRSIEPISIDEARNRLIQLYQDSDIYEESLVLESIRFLGAAEAEQ